MDWLYPQGEIFLNSVSLGDKTITVLQKYFYGGFHLLCTVAVTHNKHSLLHYWGEISLLFPSLQIWDCLCQGKKGRDYQGTDTRNRIIWFRRRKFYWQSSSKQVVTDLFIIYHLSTVHEAQQPRSRCCLKAILFMGFVTFLNWEWHHT